ncbi:MAG: DUF4093 domain-containing protein [Clostridia bacterium]|nr:DUF4093 domain-containing protein [Clostridia bacterium]
MIKLKQTVIVEGKYDKITLENIIDALIIKTDGFGIFKDKEKCALIRKTGEKNGIIIMTDSDSAGSVIRGYIKKIASNCEIINVYVPCLKGKEKRKASPSKEGILGVEGMSREVILKALEKSGVLAEESSEIKEKITKTDMFEFGLSGTENSADNRKKLLKELELPENLSPNALLDVLNNFYSREEFFEVMKNGKYQFKA